MVIAVRDDDEERFNALLDTAPARELIWEMAVWLIAETSNNEGFSWDRLTSLSIGTDKNRLVFPLWSRNRRSSGSRLMY